MNAPTVTPILSRAQARSLYTAMTTLNAIGGRLVVHDIKTEHGNLSYTVAQHPQGFITIGNTFGVREKHASQAEFAMFYLVRTPTS